MTPLVLVHGFMGGSAQWALQQRDLSRQVQFCAVDLPGFGANAGLPPVDTIGGFADWVLDHLSALGIDRFDLLGHSMGGMIVQEMVHRAPERVKRLILYGTGAVGVLPGRFETIDESKRRARADGAEATARRIAATWFLAQKDSPQYEACADIAATCNPGSIPAGLDAMQSWDGAEMLADITCKTMVLWGDHDRTYPWAQTEMLWRRIPGASLGVVPGCAHAVHMEKPGLFNRLVLDFLSDPG